MKRYVLLIIAILMIISGIICSFFSSFAKDVNQSRETSTKIEEKYKELKDSLSAFNGERENLYNVVINDLYIEKVETSYDTWILTYEGYQKFIKNIKDYQPFLKKYCFSTTYADSNTQSKCESMMLSYETAINYYVKDINKFNQFIKGYNEEKEDAQKKQLLDLKKDNYIDFNDDGKYTGK